MRVGKNQRAEVQAPLPRGSQCGCCGALVKFEPLIRCPKTSRVASRFHEAVADRIAHEVSGREEIELAHHGRAV
jgi:hypothetical protein